MNDLNTNRISFPAKFYGWLTAIYIVLQVKLALLLTIQTRIKLALSTLEGDRSLVII